MAERVLPQRKKGESAIAIIAPMTLKKMTEVRNDAGMVEEKEVSWTTYRAVPVFDVSQTEGKEIPRLAQILNGDVDKYTEIVNGLRSFAQVEISFEPIQGRANGYYIDKDKKIVVKEGMSEEQTVKTMVHEIAHSMLHCEGGEQEKVERDEAEQQAESVAYVVSKWLGIDTSDYSFGYIAGWSQDKEAKTLIADMEVIRKTAGKIIDFLSKIV